jgi:type II secretory pathway component PulJ
MVNAKLAPHGKITRYMNGTNREARLEATLLRLERDLDANLPAVLVKMLKRSRTELITINSQLQEARSALRELVLQEPGMQQVGSIHNVTAGGSTACQARKQACSSGQQQAGARGEQQVYSREAEPWAQRGEGGIQ